MRVPLLDLKAQLETIRDELSAAVLEVVESTRYVLGPRVEALEEQIADYLGARFAIGVSSGTDALLAAFMGLGIGPGDRVLTTPYTFFATAGCVSRLGAKPVFVDIEADSFNLCPKALRRTLEHEPDPRRVRCIVPVHLYGQCADMDPILDLGREYGIPVLEDAAQAIGATYPSRDGERRAGTMGVAGTFSFFPSKNLGGIGDGGMIVSDDEALAERIRTIRVHGSKPKYYHNVVGGNFRLDPIQAAALSVKLPHLDAWNEKRRRVASYYDENLDVPGIVKPALRWGRDRHIYHQYVILVPERRNELAEFLGRNEIGTSIYYPLSLHEQACFADLGYRRGDLPHCELAAERSLALPIYPELTTEMQDFVIAKIREFHG